MPRRQVFLAIALCLFGATGAQAASRPEGFEAAARRGDRVDILGIGFGQTGQFRLSDGSGAGTYQRSSRWQTWTQDLGDRTSHSRTDGQARLAFTLNDGRDDGPLSANCEAHAVGEQVSAGALSISEDSRPLDLSCTLARGGRVIGDMDLRAVPPTGLRVQDHREGQIRLGQRTLRLTSVHHFEGRRTSTESPLGYLLMQNDHVVGAVDVNRWRTSRLVLPRSPELRDAALAASLVLALQWQPSTEN